MNELRRIDDIPVKYRSIFSSLKNFNSVQSEVFDDVLNTKKHIVVSAPTGSGKTKIFELAIVELLISVDNELDCKPKDLKIIYVAPTKALCNEIYQTWRLKFKPFDINVALVTGDSDPKEMANLGDLIEYQIAVTTPEKWDAITRKWKDHQEIASAVRLVLIDEVQLVGDIFRGPTLEAIVSRLKSIEQNTQPIRFISVSASLPNIEDIAKWISAGQMNDSVRTFQIDESKRPVKLTRRVMGYNNFSGNSFRFNISLTYELAKIVNRLLVELKKEAQILIFCNTRNDVEYSLEHLLKNIQLKMDETHQSALKRVSQRIKDEKLRSSVEAGYAFHHAGLTYEDREHIENIYRDGLIKILLSTNTLAVGVNLPAHTVIIKSTEMFMQGTTREIPESMILQMIGRAGRQQYNTTGCVYIMTKPEKVKYYETLTMATVQLDSHLSKKLAEFLIAEIALNTITDTNASLMQWIKTTFLYTRTIKKMSVNAANSNLKDLSKQAIDKLMRAELIDIKLDDSLSILSYGNIMAKYFLSIQTMNAFKTLCGTETIEDLLDKITNCVEFTETYFCRDELKNLNDINSGYTGKRIRFLIPGKIKMFHQKVSCALQAILGNVPVKNTALLMNAKKVIQIAERIANSLIEYFQSDQFTGNCFNALLSSMVFAKSLKTHTWSDIQVFGQLDISDDDAAKLIASNIKTIDDLLKTNPREIEDMFNKQIPYGNEFIEDVLRKFPSYDVKTYNVAENVINIRVSQSNILYESAKDTKLKLIVGDSCNRLILCDDIQPILDEKRIYEKLLSYSADALGGIIHLIHHNFVGVDKTIRFKTKMVPSPKSITSINDANGNVSINAKEAMPHKILGEKSAKKTKSIISTDQKILPQYYQTVKSAFDQRKLEPIKPIVIHSPDLFPTQGDAQKPKELYISFNTQDYLLSQYDWNADIRQNNPVKQLNGSPLLVETPIQSKIMKQRCAPNNFDNGFVCASDIFKVIPTDLQKPQPLPKLTHSIDQIDPVKEIALSQTSKDSICELDNDFIEMVYAELKDLNSSGQIHGLIGVKKESHKENSENSMQKILSQNNNLRDANVLTHDFDDCEFLEQVENLDSSFWEEFHSEENEIDGFEQRNEMNSPVNQKVLGNQETVQPKTISIESKPSVIEAPVSTNHVIVTNYSQDSESSNKAICGSPIQNESDVAMPKMKRTLNDFVYQAKPMMHSTALRENVNQQRKEFMEIDPSIEAKKPKIDLNEMIANKKRKDNEYIEKIRKLRFAMGQPIKQQIGKASVKNTFTRVMREDKSEALADKLIRQCKERRKEDEEYSRNGYHSDYVRYKYLKLLPEENEEQINKQKSPEHNFPEFHDDDRLYINDATLGNIKDDPFPTQESYSSFFSQFN